MRRSLLYLAIYLIACPLSSFAQCPTAAFNFDEILCTGDEVAVPEITPGSGEGMGWFSAVPAGLAIEANGTIDLAASDPGTYLVKWTIPPFDECPGVIFKDTVTVDMTLDATFSYPSSTICITGTNPLPDYIATPGGTFMTGPWGLVDPESGEFFLLSAVPGDVISVTYSFSGTCLSSHTQYLGITDAAAATFSYSDPFYPCEPNPFPDIPAWSNAGTFSASPSGLVIDAMTGEIDVELSLPGNYYVTNMIPASGGCSAVSETESVTIVYPFDATLSYPSESVCIYSGNPVPDFIFPTGGTFTVDGGATIDAATGEFDLATASSGNCYNIVYTTSEVCSSTDTFTLCVYGFTAEDFTYGGPFCPYDPDPTPMGIPGPPYGVFTSVPAGLVIDPVTGTIDLDASSPGTLTVTVDIPASGGCPAYSLNTDVTIQPVLDPTFSYPSSTHCITWSNPLPDYVAYYGEFFSIDGGALIDAVTGEIDLASTTAGETYTITHTSTGACPATFSFELTITPGPIGDFYYEEICPTDIYAFPMYVPGASAGTFTAVPVGLTIDAATGQVDVPTSTPGTYTVSNTIAAAGGCAAVISNSTITIPVPLDPSWTNPGPLCEANGPIDLNALIEGMPGGIWSGTGVTGGIFDPQGLEGEIAITYTVGEMGCEEALTQSITVLPDVDPSWVSPTEPICSWDMLLLHPLVTGTPGGTFWGTGVIGSIFYPFGLSGDIAITYIVGDPLCEESLTQFITAAPYTDPFWTNPGIISCGDSPVDLASLVTGTAGGTFSGPGVIGSTFNPVGLSGLIPVTYTVGNAPCEDELTRNITVLPSVNPSWTNPGIICETDGPIDLASLVTGSPGGTFSGPGVTASSFNPAGLSGTIPITYAVDIEECGDSSLTQEIEIVADTADPAFSYPASGYCSSGSNPIPNFIASPGGAFSIDGGAAIDPATGEVDLGSLESGETYTVSYTTPGPCGSSSEFEIGLSPALPPDATFTYPYETFCETGIEPIPESVSSAGGLFSISGTGTGAFIDPSSGEIDFSAATSGIYAVTYTMNEPCYSTYSDVFRYIDAGEAGFTADIIAGSTSVDFSSFVEFNPYYHIWEFGDGTSTNVALVDTIVHDYEAPGSYTVCHTAFWYGGCVYEHCEAVVLGESCSGSTPVSGLTALSNPAGTHAALSWDPLEGAALYQVQGRPVGSTSFAGFITPNSFKNIGGLTPGISYEWRVRAKCSDAAVGLFSGIDVFTMSSPGMVLKDGQVLGRISLYPNPAQDWILVSLPGTDQSWEISVYDINGVKLITERSEGADVVLNVEWLASGIYIVAVKGDSGDLLERLKFVRE